MTGITLCDLLIYVKKIEEEKIHGRAATMIKPILTNLTLDMSFGAQIQYVVNT